MLNSTPSDVVETVSDASPRRKLGVAFGWRTHCPRRILSSKPIGGPPGFRRKTYVVMYAPNGLPPVSSIGRHEFCADTPCTHVFARASRSQRGSWSVLNSVSFPATYFCLSTLRR